MLGLLPIDSERRRACAAHDTRQPAWRWRPQMACGTTAARRWREASRRGSALSWGNRPTTTSAAWRVRVASSSAGPPPHRQRAQARLCRARGSQFGVRGRSWIVAQQPRVEGGRPLAGAVPFLMYGTTTTSAARRARAASSSAGLLPIDSERRCACAARDTQQPAWHWRP